MRSFIMCLAALFAAPLIADNIGDLQFDTPAIGHEWKVENKFSTDMPKSSTLIYVSQENTLEESEEVFAVNVSDLPFNNEVGPIDLVKLQKIMEDQFRNLEVRLNPLVISDNEVFYEWSVFDKGVEELHGWTRSMNLTSGSAGLTFQTENIAQVDGIRSAVVDCLQKAKAV
ncbi:MAG: hypothetical protein JHC93_00135 [Parachlamydiales bacterium]|nr:hypothetical protein [Parachlamydiales bacterium]